MIKVFILEDELRNRKLLNTMLTKYCSDIEVIGEADTIEDAERLIYRLSPDLVFMDIHLASKTAFELLDLMPNRKFEVIFTTAHEQYAVKAIKYSGIDYLLKPIDLEELKVSLQRAKVKILRNRRISKESDNIIEMSAPGLVVPTQQGYIMLDASSIMFMQADGAYTTIYLKDNSQIIVSCSIGSYEKKLPFPNFIRIHRSCLVNKQYIQEYVRGRGGYVLLNNGKQLSVSVRKKNDLLNAIGV